MENIFFLKELWLLLAANNEMLALGLGPHNMFSFTDLILEVLWPNFIN